MPPWSVVKLVVVSELIVTCDLKSKVFETGVCSVMGLFRVSEARGWQSKSILDLSWHCYAFAGWYLRTTFQVLTSSNSWPRVIPTLCGHTGVYHIVEYVSYAVLMYWSLDIESRSSHVVAARTQRWNYTRAGLSNTAYVFKDLEWNAIRQEPGYTKHRRVSSTCVCTV